ncbi:MAG: DUF932 domain-containing protein, partial [Gammaproteobacteria bacterium]|nr:DUF932 domain-containing protein [Gammaproteobacteria bacterium]
VCQNTLNAAIRNSSNVFKVYHRKNFASKKDEAAKVLGCQFWQRGCTLFNQRRWPIHQSFTPRQL